MSTILFAPFNEPAEQAEAYILGREPQDGATSKPEPVKTGESAYKFIVHDWKSVSAIARSAG